MNAVRSHYSPDRHFLDICDSLGILYLDEFCGWHGRYDTPTGEKLLREQMATDQNHPCIFVWANGNEGGWNTQLDIPGRTGTVWMPIIIRVITPAQDVS